MKSSGRSWRGSRSRTRSSGRQEGGGSEGKCVRERGVGKEGTYTLRTKGKLRERERETGSGHRLYSPNKPSSGLV